MADREGTKLTIIIAILIVLTTYILIKIIIKLNGDEIKCKNSIPLHARSITTYDKKYKDINDSNNKTIKDLYIKTAYNCCAISDRWLDLCALEYTINERCRCLDFAIFDYMGFPVVGTTTTPNGLSMDSYNYINFDKVMKTVIKKGFVDNITDPLFINLRIKSASLKLYDLIASILNKYIIGSKLLSINYTYYTYYNNSKKLDLNELTMDVLRGKVVIMISDYNTSTFEKSNLQEYTNILGEVVNTGYFEKCEHGETLDDLLQINNGHIINGNITSDNITSILDLSNNILISIPDDINYNPNYCYYKKAGVNFIGMSFQNNIKPSKKTLKKTLKKNFGADNKYFSELLDYEMQGNLDNYNKWFNDNNTSFIIKTEDDDNDDNDENTTGCYKKYSNSSSSSSSYIEYLLKENT
jgi:hypothetical protein